MERKLASIQKIISLDPIPNAVNSAGIRGVINAFVKV